MAKIWDVSGLDCSADFATNARRVIAVRTDELYANARALEDPRDAVGHHDLRISVKRIRYSLEFFAICFDAAEVEWLLAGFSDLQELLGDLHDADELIPQLHGVIGEAEEARAAAIRRDLGPAGAGDAGGVAAFKAALDGAPGTPYEVGLLGLVARLREQREVSYAGAKELWERLEAEGLAGRLGRLAAEPPAGGAPE